MIAKIEDKQIVSERKEERNRFINKVRLSLQTLPVINKSVLKLEKKKSKRKYSMSTNEVEEQQEQTYQYHNLDKFYEKYEILEKIGEGGNGLVKKCFHKKKMVYFAMKKIHYQEQHILFLSNSFKYIKQLDHPAIIKYHSMYMCPTEHQCYLVMEFFNHPNLLEYKSLNEEDLKIISLQLINAVCELHKKGICHRDIKPENILYDQVLQAIRLIDLGVCRRFQNRTLKKDLLTVTGTLFYRAPEMFEGAGYDETIDEWAIGITLYKLIEGKTPFQSLYVNETIENIRDGKITFQNKAWDKISKGLKDLISRFLKPKKDRLTAEKAKKHFWFSPEVMNHEKISISQILDDSSIKKEKLKLKKATTMRGDGKGIGNLYKTEMNDSKKMVKSWRCDPDKSCTETIFESDDEEYNGKNA